MKGKPKVGIVAAALGKLVDAVRETIPGPAPVLRPNSHPCEPGEAPTAMTGFTKPLAPAPAPHYLP